MCGIMQVGELKSLVGIAMCGIMQTEGLKLPTSICDAVQAWGTFSLLYPLLPLLTIPASCLAATSHSPPASHHSGFLPSKHHSFSPSLSPLWFPAQQAPLVFRTSHSEHDDGGVNTGPL